jgi:hypothetical protein
MVLFRLPTSLTLIAASGLAIGVCLFAPQGASAQTTLATPTDFGTSPAPMGGSPKDPCGFHKPYGYIGADDITFSAVVSGPANVQLAAEFLIVPSNGSTPLDLTAAAVSGSPALVVVPEDDFTNGVTYAWQVRATDSDEDTSPYTRACHFISDQTIPPEPTVSSATFNSTTTPVAGTEGTFTFSVSGPDVSAVTGFDYVLNNPATGAATGFAAVRMHGTATTAAIRPIVPGVNTVTVDTVDHAGNISQPVTYVFDLGTPPAAADADMNGDGIPDLLTVGGTAGLAPGLWLATGKAKPSVAAETGQLNTPATNIGINGAELGVPSTPSEFDGADVITGQFFAQGFNDVLVYFPSGNSAGGGVILHGTGNGAPLPAVDENVNIPIGSLADANGDNPLQLVNAYTSLYDTGFPDLLAINGDPVNGYYLDYYEDGFAPGILTNTFSIQTPTPDGTEDWNDWTLATLSYPGGVGMFLWNESTGALYLWTGVTFTDNGNGTGSIAYTQYELSSDWNTGQPLTTLEAADFGGSGVPDLWAVTPSGIATAYVVSNLANGTGTITAGEPQNLT